MIRILLAHALFAALCFAQQPAPLVFDVASVRASAPNAAGLPSNQEIKGGPGTADPTRMSFTSTPMRRILMTAFGVPIDEISGSDWVMGQDAKFDIVANLPAGATKEQASEMLVNLLKERFHLKYHRVTKDFDFYALVIAKGGPKLKDAEPAPNDQPAAVIAAKDQTLDGNGFPIVPPGRKAMRGVGANRVSKMTFRMSTPQDLLTNIAFTLRPSRTIDKTGLTGQYDFHLEYAEGGLMTGAGRGASSSITPEVDDPAPDVFTAVEKQLGLKLEKSKIPLDVYVIDSIDKIPTEN